MSNSFSLQVTPELMQRLAEQGKEKPRRRRAAKKSLVPHSPVSPLPTQQTWHDPEAQYPSAIGGWPGQETFYPPFGGPQPPFAALFGGPPVVEPSVQPSFQRATDLQKELAPVYQAIDDSENISQKLQKRGTEDLEKVQEMARDLQEKQYRAPSNAPPCTMERGSCIDCYKQNPKDPLLCSKLVQAFVTCSRQAQDAFTASLAS